MKGYECGVYHACVSGRKESLVVVRVNEKNNKKRMHMYTQGNGTGRMERKVICRRHTQSPGRMDGRMEQEGEVGSKEDK